MNIFVGSNDYVEINLYIGEEDGYLSCVTDEKEAKKLFDDEKYEVHWVRFKDPTYGTSLKIQELSFSVNDGRAEFDPISFRANRCFTLLKDWSFVDENNNKVPPTRESMEKMSDVVAQTILLELDKV
tara:strand:+ start:2077 stop:2457 length:381 start_codon:yes stop_codon:yes gene_type:complete